MSSLFPETQHFCIHFSYPNIQTSSLFRVCKPTNFIYSLFHLFLTFGRPLCSVSETQLTFSVFNLNSQLIDEALKPYKIPSFIFNRLPVLILTKRLLKLAKGN